MKVVLWVHDAWGSVKRCSILLLVDLLLVQPLNASALSKNELNFFGQNNILYYDPEARNCYSGTLSGEGNFAKVVSYFSGNNKYNISVSAEAIAGIVANFKAESGLSPFRNEVGGGGYGIAQFTPRDSIVNTLKTDIRTSGYFNTYYDSKYGGPVGETGIPDGVPDEVDTAWLEVQLDYISSSELQSTKVKSYRNSGGSMGLEYIDGNLSILEAMNRAESASDAARIWVWIYERSRNKASDAEKRSIVAEEILPEVKALMGSSGSVGVISDSPKGVSGENVTIIGDSITVGASEELQAVLPGVEINAEVGRQFDAGVQILENMIANNSLRDVVVFALGTNSVGLTHDKVQAVVDKAGKERKVIFVTNYVDTSKRSGLDYTSNNNAFKLMQNENKNVAIADWVSVADSSLISDDGLGVHPNSEGQQKFADLIASAVSNTNNEISVCATAVDGGMTDEQAQQVVDYYKSGAVSDAGMPAGTKWNCVSLVAFFIRNFTTLGNSASPSKTGGWGDGKHTAYNAGINFGLETGTEPRPYAIFSVTSGQTVCDGGLCGHTGIVVAVNGDDVTIIEAAYSKPKYTAVVHKPLSYFKNAVHPNAVFAYTDSIVDMEKIDSFLNGGEL